jgi:hypothetical protein
MGKDGKTAGTYLLKHFERIPTPCFTQYLKTGWKIKLHVAIDYTQSNLDYKKPNSLHSIADGGINNQYLRAIQMVGKILQEYSEDKLYPTFGFGGKPRFMGSDDVSHCFPLNGNAENPTIHGIHEIAETYMKTLTSIKLYGPTYFNAIIDGMVSQVDRDLAQNLSIYHILLILTDGEIHDMEQVKQQIVMNSGKPISFIIVGVGQADFEHMHTLDSDGNLLRDDNGNVAHRDIVQFVEFLDSVKKGDLAKDVLKEVPE